MGTNDSSSKDYTLYTYCADDSDCTDYDFETLENEDDVFEKTTLLNTRLLNTSHHFSHTDIYEINRQKAQSFFPVFIVLGCIVVLGILCNILVCYIYRCRSRRATSNFFVIFFAIFDMFGCFVGIPLEICALAIPYIYDVDFLCRIMGFIETFSVCSLCLTLICVSYDCYRKHCRRAEGYGMRQARYSCVISLVVALVVSMPAFFVFRTHSKPVKFLESNGNAEINADVCSIDKSLPLWSRLVYYICVVLTFTVSLIVMTILYGLIGVNWWKQRVAEERGEKPLGPKRNFPKKHRFVREETSTSSANYTEEICRLHSQGTSSSLHSQKSQSDPARVPLKPTSGGGSTSIVKTNSLQASSAPPSVAIVQLHVKHTRQTSIFLVIFCIFIVTMLPYVVVTVLFMTTDYFDTFSSHTTEMVVALCMRSYLLNYTGKPVVYLIFNLNFRKEVKHMFSKLWALCTLRGSGWTSGSSHTNSQQKEGTRQMHRSFTIGAQRSTSRVPIYRPPKHSV